MELPIYSYIIAGCCALLAAWNLFRLMNGSSLPGMPQEGVSMFDGTTRKAGERIAQFQKRIRALSAKVDMVEEHAGEYFMVLNDNGWATVIALLEGLYKVSEKMDVLVANDKVNEALDVITWLDGTDVHSQMPDVLRHLLGVDCESLRKWDDSVNKIIIDVATALQEAAEDTKKLGIDRKHKRKPTLVAVDELMRMLEKRHAQKSSVKDW